MNGRLFLLGFLAWGLLGSVGCAADVDDETTDTSADELLRKTSSTSRWSYHGIMPELESPRITVSLKGHTVRIDGLLPETYRGRLPFHAKTVNEGGRVRVHVAYPIATGNLSATNDDGTRVRNPEPGSYKVCGGDNAHATNDVGAFGGFPFMQYVCNHADKDGRMRDGIAFHGPISSKSAEGASYWALSRGPVSHACNRMLGEHVLEMAHVIGFSRGKRNVPVKVLQGFDSFQGKTVDVDYPATGWTRPKRSESAVFEIWQAVRQESDGSLAIDFPQWACERSRCASMPANTRDPYTGDPI